MATQTIFYDRVDIYVNGEEYLPDGYITNFSLTVTYNTKINHGFSKTGLGTGKTLGNKKIESFGWTEYLVQSTDFLDWRTYCMANPNTVLTVIPFSISNGSPEAPAFTITGVDPISIGIAAPGEGNEMSRSCTFNAIDSTNT